MLAAVDLIEGHAAGDLVLKVVAICPQELAEPDFTAMALVRLVPGPSDPEGDEIAASHLKQQVLDRLAESYDFPIPPGLVQHELAAIWTAADAQLRPSGDERDALAAELTRIAERRVRLGIVVSALARAHALRVSDEEVASARRVMPEAARALEAPVRMRGRLLEEKVIAWIVSRARVEDRRVTREELARIVETMERTTPERAEQS
jgi:trigger factor